MRVLIVDDTITYRSMLRIALSEVQGIEIVGTASNGKLALQKLEQVPTDVVIMDIEMPEMDGLEAVREIKRLGYDVKVIMFSSMTKGSAELTMKALHDGADDVVAKPGSDVKSQDEAIAKITGDLIPKIMQFKGMAAKPNVEVKAPVVTLKTEAPRNWKKVGLSSLNPEFILLASSTGGPAALEVVFEGLGSEHCPPILIAQHMPPLFTKMLADRIQRISNFKADEAKGGEIIKKGHVYVAPGDFHLEINRGADNQLVTKLNQGPKVNSVRPAADVLFDSAINATSRPALAIVLTGMGEDGLRGCQTVKNSDGYVFIQSQETCVVFGMPGAVYQNGCYDQIGDLKECHALIKHFC